jgi:hypothetical protein
VLLANTGRERLDLPPIAGEPVKWDSHPGKLFGRQFLIKNTHLARHWWLTSAILAT